MDNIWSKIRTIVITVLATLGVLFVILMLWPEDKEETEVSSADESVESEEDKDGEDMEIEKEDGDIEKDEDSGQSKEELSEEKEDKEEAVEAKDNDEKTDGNSVKINIPESDISSYKFDFKTVSLDNEEVTEDIFSDYDITIVYMWGTFCGSCIAEMGDLAEFYENKPDNINLVGLVTDVYDGLDNNVDEAKKILSDVDASFLNIRSSDDLYDVLSSCQYVPSFFLVNREGYLIGAPYEGAGFDATLEVLEKYYD